MSTDAPMPNNHEVPPGLPPVRPPSGRFILQLFLIPGLIVAGLVFVFIFGGLAWVGSSSPESFLAQLDNPNPDIRWRAAHELAQVLQRPESLELASNPDFALDMAERLQKALASLEQAENTTKDELGAVMKRIQDDTSLSEDEKAKRQDQAALAAWNKLRPERDFVIFLTGCMGQFNIPVGVHALSTIAMKDKSAEIKGLSQRRRLAVHALANLGNNMRQHFFGKDATDPSQVLTAQQKTIILDKLARAAAGTGGRAKLAEYAHDVLLQKQPSQVDTVLAFCAKSNDIYLRKM